MSLLAPLVASDCDCRDLDGFMLNVERLMASELVALSTHGEIAAALMLWCRAWKQIPAASLPNDDRVNAAFAKLSLAKFKKCKETVLRGFILCSDGRLYHTFLSIEATRAFARKCAFQVKRETDATRLREWRASHKGNHSETPVETRFVAEGQGQVLSTEANASDADASNHEPSIKPVYSDAKHELWGEGKVMLAELGVTKSQAGGLMGRWMKDARDDAAGVLDAIRRARDAKPVDPVAWITRAIIPAEKPNGQDRSASSAAKRLQASLASLGDPPPAMLPAPNSRGQGEDTNRIISQG